MYLNTDEDKFSAIKSLMDKYSAGAINGSFIHRLTKEIEKIIDLNIIDYDFCKYCLGEISNDVESDTDTDDRKYHKFCHLNYIGKTAKT